MDPDARVATWASAHHSLITRDAAHRAGLNDRQIRYRARTGRWVEIRSNVWSPAGAARTPLMELAAVTLSVPTVASHRSAAWLHRLVDEAPAVPEVTGAVGVGHHVGSDVRMHRTSDLTTRDTQTIDGIRCTNAVRTCIDMGARLDADALERLIERARHRQLIHLSPLITRFLQLARPGRDGTATVRKVLRRMDPALEPAESDLETLLMQVLRTHGVEPPVRQHPVRILGRDFRIDVAYPDRRIAIESDGFTDHGLRSSFEDDRERQNLLALEGWTVLRFTWRQICGQPEWVARQVQLALDRTQRVR